MYVQIHGLRSDTLLQWERTINELFCEKTPQQARYISQKQWTPDDGLSVLGWNIVFIETSIIIKWEQQFEIIKVYSIL